jgi:SAM-dependent methyltransferase
MTGNADPLRGLAEGQHAHWQRTYEAHPELYGMEPSAAAAHAATAFRDAGAHRLLELGAGHGRDAVHFARRGFEVTAADFSATALAQLLAHASTAGLGSRLRTLRHDVRDPLPFADASFDAVYSHMLLCMALSTVQIRAAVAEVRRVLRPGGLFVYTVRHTGDAHHGEGIPHGDGIYEYGGFAVHFFDRALVDSLAEGWDLLDLHPFEEGELPRLLWRVTQRKSRA